MPHRQMLAIMRQKSNVYNKGMRGMLWIVDCAIVKCKEDIKELAALTSHTHVRLDTQTRTNHELAHELDRRRDICVCQLCFRHVADARDIFRGL